MALRTAGDDGLTKFIERAKRYPMLSLERERELALRWREHRHEAALDALLGSHLRFVIKIARGFAGYGLPLADLVAEGNVGLMQAAEKFDPDRGFRFATYAMWWIRAAIQEYVLHSWSLVKMGTTAAQKKLFFNLRRVKARMEELDSGDLSPETVRAIATELDVPENDVVEMNRRLAANDSSLNIGVGEDGDEDWLSRMPDERANQEATVVAADELAKRRHLMREAFDVLNDRERRILVERRLKDEPATLEQLSHEFEVSRERVRQIEVRAFEKLQKAMLAASANQRLAEAA